MRAKLVSLRVPGLIALALTAMLTAALPAAAAQASAAPAPGAVLAGNGVLNDVVATSSSNAWAVGHYGSVCTGTRTLIEHWNGNAWQRVKVRPVRGWLDGVAATSAHDVWVTGSAGTGGALILHFNGRTWRRYSPGGVVVADVTALSPTDAWAVGIAGNGSLILHWNGKTWRRVPSPSPGGVNPLLTGVSAVSAKNIWAVGGFSHTLTLHWNGSVWRRVPSPSPVGGSALQGVAAVSAHDVWAVGESTHGTLVLHWNGTSWRKVASPPVAKGAGLLGVSGRFGRDVWAVGTTGGLIASCSAGGSSPRTVSNAVGGTISAIASDARAAAARPEPVILHWNGTSWRRVSAPRPANGGQLFGVFTASGRPGFAVGCTRTFGKAKARPLVVRLKAP